MEREKEQWIKAAMDSLEGIQPAVPPATMQNRIMQRLQTEQAKVLPVIVRATTVYKIAAAVAFIITLNIVTCAAFSKNINQEKGLQSFAKTYSLSGSSNLMDL